jgi:Uncharacterized conserved protein
MRKCFQLVNEHHSKFWTVEVVGNTYLATFGKIGTYGQTQVKSFPTNWQAENKAYEMIREKEGKGYIEVAERRHPGAGKQLLDSLAVPTATPAKQEAEEQPDTTPRRARQIVTNL